jgi:signal transduction histidine kinase/CheY-like chemotaxis protein
MIRRVFISVVLVVAFFGLTLSVAAFLVTKSSFSAIDKERISQATGLARSFVFREIDGLATTTGDWSHWNETYNFVANGMNDKTYMSENINYATFQQIRVKTMLFVDSGNNMVGFSVDKATESLSFLGETEKRNILTKEVDVAVSKALSGECCKGIAFINGVPYVIIASPITTNEDRKSSNGALVFFRHMSPMLEVLGQSLESFQVLPVLCDGTKDVDVSLNKGMLFGSFFIPCVCQDFYYKASVTSKSLYADKGKSLVEWFIGGVFILISGMAFALWYVFRVFVLNRLVATMKSVRDISTSEGLEKKFEGAEKKDEFGIFVRALNGMLMALRKEAEGNKEKDAAIRRSERVSLLGKFAGGVAHDMNNQLAVIKGYADSLKYAKTLPEALGQCDKISRVVDGCTELIGKILSFSKRGNVGMEKIDVNSLVNNVLVLFNYVLDSKHLQVEHRVEALRSVVVGSPSELQNAILNILVNAREAVSDNGCICVSTKNVKNPDGLTFGEYVAVTIEDSGPGFPQEIMENLFVPFQTTKVEGVGLGLSVVHGVASRHKGSVYIDNTPGRTAVTIYLPCVVGTRDSQRICVGCKSPKKILLHVDDERSIREIVKLQFESHGYVVKSFSDGASGVQFFKENVDDIGVVLLDYCVPPLDGLDILREIREISQDVPVAFMTGFYEMQIEDLEGMGVYGIFEKPVDFPSLLRITDDVLLKS